MCFTYSEIKMLVVLSAISLNSSDGFQNSLSKEKDVFHSATQFLQLFIFFHCKKNLELKADIFQVVNLTELLMVL